MFTAPPVLSRINRLKVNPFEPPIVCDALPPIVVLQTLLPFTKLKVPLLVIVLPVNENACVVAVPGVAQFRAPPEFTVHVLVMVSVRAVPVASNASVPLSVSVAMFALVFSVTVVPAIIVTLSPVEGGEPPHTEPSFQLPDFTLVLLTALAVNARQKMPRINKEQNFMISVF